MVLVIIRERHRGSRGNVIAMDAVLSASISAVAFRSFVFVPEVLNKFSSACDGSAMLPALGCPRMCAAATPPCRVAKWEGSGQRRTKKPKKLESETVSFLNWMVGCKRRDVIGWLNRADRSRPSRPQSGVAARSASGRWDSSDRGAHRGGPGRLVRRCQY
jgi:hypothetical protein